MGGTSEYDAFAPKENVRIKMNGSGLKFRSWRDQPSGNGRAGY